MTTTNTPEASEPRPAAGPSVNTTATFIVSDRVVTSAGLLCCDAGDFHTVTIESPDNATQLVVGGTRHDLVYALRAALAALEVGVELPADPSGAEDVELDAPVARDVAAPARLA
jgi:hypothetical protein